MKPERESVRFVSLYFILKFTILLFFTIFVVYCGSLFSGYPYNKPQSLNDFADSLAGFFAPLSFLFLLAGFYYQNREFRISRIEMRHQIAQSKFSGMAPFFQKEMEALYGELDDILSDEIYYELNDSVREVVSNDMYLSSLDLMIDNFRIKQNHKILNESRKDAIQFIKEDAGLSVFYPFFGSRNFDYISSEYIRAYDSLSILYKNADGGGEIEGAFRKSRYGDMREKTIIFHENSELITEVKMKIVILSRHINESKDWI